MTQIITGRPTKYRDTYPNVVEDYLKHCLATEDIPFVEELCVNNHWSSDSIADWVRDNEEFSRTIRELKALQSLRMQKNGLLGKYNANMARFLLSSNHGMSETTKTQADVNLNANLDGLNPEERMAKIKELVNGPAIHRES